MRPDDALLLDMLIAARKIQKFTAALSEEDFNASDLVQSAVLREFQVIGEAARMVTEEMKTQHSVIAWRAIAGMRNRMIHEYFNVDTAIVWATIRDDLPQRIEQLSQIVPPESDDR